MFVGRVLETAEYDGRAVFGEPPDFAHVHVVQAVFAAWVRGRDDEARGVHVVELDVHAWPVEEGAALAEVGGATRGVAYQVMGAGGHREGVGHGDGAVESLNECGMPGGHLGPPGLGDEGHGKFGGFGGRMDGKADVGGEFGSDRVGEGLCEKSQYHFGGSRGWFVVPFHDRSCF